MEQNKKRILTGDRTTGRLHLGHYVGSLKSRVELQDSYDTFILLADVQALTTHFEHPELINSSIYDVTMDNLAVGLDPAKVTFVQQSQITSIAELTVFYSMIVTVNQLRHNPTIKTEAKNYGYADLTYGFLGYPVSQTADITFCNANLVPVGEDQVPHIELARKIVRKFNDLYGTSIVEPEAKLSAVGRLSGLDGNAKMGKSLGNAIYLSDTPETVWDRVRNAVTDPARITIKIPGHPEICNVYKYHCVFNPDEKDDIADRCRNAQIGCVACKKRLNEVLNSLLDPIRERRAYYEGHREQVRELIIEGTRRANQVGNDNLHAIKEKMHVLI
ncbi:tryptophan--tRNA ligase [Sphaerochaeta globosa]|uniref:Tryptophan--tRNA ligase n=1 Tax=Sphaerochaeta globosa (strain ATCC BAA-1886 / DSM 22777 / Buddy) TaxID=158189 RepID=F0RVT0_SPHGB|nr:tryptophan--tRNA ligase [Sphaerochaeta globosa]ADY13142.1 tryptophanyl-tRNA synthetase [Sphaerochaeta globosa str. Buddy]